MLPPRLAPHDCLLPPPPLRFHPPLMIQMASSPAGAVGELLWHGAPAPTVTGAVILRRLATPAATPTIPRLLHLLMLVLGRRVLVLWRQLVLEPVPSLGDVMAIDVVIRAEFPVPSPPFPRSPLRPPPSPRLVPEATKAYPVPFLASSSRLIYISP